MLASQRSKRADKPARAEKLVSVDGSRPTRDKASKTARRSRSRDRGADSARKQKITLHRHARSRSPDRAARQAVVIEVDSPLHAIVCSSLSEATSHLTQYIDDWLTKHVPKCLGARSDERSQIALEEARAPQWAAVFDLDETVLHYNEGKGIRSEVDKECHLPREMYNFLNFLRRKGVKIVYITARREGMVEQTRRTLESMRLWREGDTLVLKPVDWPSGSSSTYKSNARKLVEQRGYSILLNAGDQFSDLMQWTRWKDFMGRLRTELPEDHLLRQTALRIRASESGQRQLQVLAASISFPIIFYALEPNVPFALKLPQQEFFTK